MYNRSRFSCGRIVHSKSAKLSPVKACLLIPARVESFATQHGERKVATHVFSPCRDLSNKCIYVIQCLAGASTTQLALFCLSVVFLLRIIFQDMILLK